MDVTAPAIMSVVVPTCRRAQSLRICLDALACQTRLDFEVIVVVDGADDATRLLAASYAAPFPIRWIELAVNGGPANARNIGAVNASAGTLLFLDDDMSPTPECVSVHADFHRESAARPRVLCGKVVDHYPPGDVDFVERCLRDDRDRNMSACESALAGSPQSRWALAISCGNNCSIPKAAYLEAGGQDVQLRCNEDMELGARLHLGGIDFAWGPEAMAVHRSAKNLQMEFPRILRQSAEADAYRAFEKSQKWPQTRAIAELCHGRATHLLKESIAWHAPLLAEGAAECCRLAANAFHSRRAFGKWKGLAGSIAYAKHLKSHSLGRAELRGKVGTPVPLLAFHSISEVRSAQEARYAMSPRRFREVVARLSKCRIAEFSFDDGYEDFLTDAAPVLCEHGVRATVYVVAGLLGKTNEWDARRGMRERRLLSIQQVRELHAMGFRVGSHSMTHADLTSLSGDELRSEVEDSRKLLEDVIGAPVISFAYPSGLFSAAVKASVARGGYKNAVTTIAGLNLWEDPFALRRVELSERDSDLDVTLKLRSGRSMWAERAAAGRSRAFGLLRRWRAPDRSSPTGTVR